MQHKFKIFILFAIIILVSCSISVFATYNYFAKDITYTKSDGTKISVESALNELYSTKNYKLEESYCSSTYR